MNLPVKFEASRKPSLTPHLKLFLPSFALRKVTISQKMFAVPAIRKLFCLVSTNREPDEMAQKVFRPRLQQFGLGESTFAHITRQLILKRENYFGLVFQPPWNLFLSNSKLVTCSSRLRARSGSAVSNLKSRPSWKTYQGSVLLMAWHPGRNN